MEFSKLPLAEELPSGIDAWDAFLSMADLPGAIFFDSATRHPRLGRYSFVVADPFDTLTWRRGDPGNPFTILSLKLSEYSASPAPGADRADLFPELPPFRGGAAGLFGYGLSHAVEELPAFRFDEFGPPDLMVGLYDLVLAFDHALEKGWIISQGFPERDLSLRRHRARQRIEEVRARISRPVPKPDDVDAAIRSREENETTLPLSALAPSFELAGMTRVLSDFSPAGFQEAVSKAIEYIYSGDVFQVNLAQRLISPQTTGPLQFYSRLRRRNPAPFSGFFHLGEFSLASASPERFLRVVGDQVQTRPIKGTRPRGRTQEEDQRIRKELRESQKDQAENVMIVDLLRNDLSRVCRPFSVNVPSLFELETYETVHHLVSEVQGQLKAGKGPLDLLPAAFPGGSVTGAPKVRAMEIIAELEPAARGAYCGSLGYIGFDGIMDSSILIRTVTLGKGWLQFPVGGGIVARSDPKKEFDETLYKAAGILRAIE